MSRIQLPRILPLSLLLLGSACTTSSMVAERERETKSAPVQRSRPHTNTEAPKAPSTLSDTRQVAANATPAPVYRSVQDAPATSQPFQEARQKIAAGQTREALPLLETYLKTEPTGQYADEAAFYLGRTALANNDAAGAIRNFSHVANLNPPSRLRGQAIYLKAVAESQTGARSEALKSLATINPQEVPANQRHGLFTLWGNLALQEGRTFESTLAYVKASKEAPDADKKQKTEAVVLEQISTRLSTAELEFLNKEYPNDFPAVDVEMRLAALKMADGRRAEAKALLSKVVMQVPPNSPTYKQANDMLARMGSSQQVLSSGKIGALLPLSGDQESLGRAVVDGIKEAFAKAGKHNLELVVADAGNTVASAKAAMERLVFEDKVMAVVGPLAGSQAEAVAAQAIEFGVPNITLALRDGLTKSGAYVFRVALTPEKQVQALVGYAHQKLNARKFAILFPRDNFGREFATAYYRAVKDWNGTVTAAESYDPEQSDFHVTIENMIGMGFPNFRKTELEERLKLAEEKAGRKLTRKETEQNGLTPIVDFDILMVPDTFRAVGQIVPALLYANVTSPKIIGPSTWNNARLLQRAGQYLEGAYFVDIFAPERAGATTKAFVDRFQVARGGLPSPLSAVGFDIGTALRMAYGNDAAPESRDELRSRLETLGNLEGVCGTYTWDARREPLSEVQLFTVRRGSFVHQGGVVIRTARE
ncbi:MAG: penicillin-binding protein activator [Bdellovibrionales bacterium]|nr:penicillin-binding protein activator [Bdellovibrionales bacterium]